MTFIHENTFPSIPSCPSDRKASKYAPGAGPYAVCSEVKTLVDLNIYGMKIVDLQQEQEDLLSFLFLPSSTNHVIEGHRPFQELG